MGKKMLMNSKHHAKQSEGHYIEVYGNAKYGIRPKLVVLSLSDVLNIIFD